MLPQPPPWLGLIAEYTNFVVPRLSFGLGVDGSAGLESVQTDALQVSGAHHHSYAILPQGAVQRMLPFIMH